MRSFHDGSSSCTVLSDVRCTPVMKKSVSSLAVSPDGLFIAAVIKITETHYGDLHPHGEEDTVNGYELLIWASIMDRWHVLGAGDAMRLGDGTDIVLIDWTLEGSLVVLSPLGTSGDFLISEIVSSSLKKYRLPSGLEIPGVLAAMPWFVTDHFPVHMKVVECPSRTSEETVDMFVVLWGDDDIVVLKIDFGHTTEATLIWREVQFLCVLLTCRSALIFDIY